MALDYGHRAASPNPTRSVASILAIVAAIASFVVDNAMLKFGLAVAGVLLGLVGFLRAASPHVSGGILSLIAVVISVLGLLWAVLDAVLF